jgi:hypothetical protein
MIAARLERIKARKHLGITYSLQSEGGGKSGIFPSPTSRERARVRVCGG